MTLDAGPPSPYERVDPDVLEEQISYYRARATEYDSWFNREGRYNRGAAATNAWRRELDEVRNILGTLELRGRDVLELAPGTGLWTRHLLDAGARVTAVDAAPEMLAQLVARVGHGGLECVQADLFDWRPTRRFDAVVSCFFVSHVPDERLEGFVGLLADALDGGGRLFLLDGLRTHTSTAADHVLPDDGVQTMRRSLEDGRTFTIVKRFRSDAELEEVCASRGFKVTVQRTETYFQVVLGSRDADVESA
jgi:cyclopropane fatty-acyl-phospholipid synthase-like methyltransferase